MILISRKNSLKISRLMAQMFSTRVNLFLSTNLPTNSVGDVDVGKLWKTNIFGDVVTIIRAFCSSDEVKLESTVSHG